MHQTYLKLEYGKKTAIVHVLRLGQGDAQSQVPELGSHVVPDLALLGPDLVLLGPELGPNLGPEVGLLVLVVSSSANIM